MNKQREADDLSWTMISLGTRECYLSDVVGGDGHCVVTARPKFGGESEGSLGAVDKVVVTDIAQTPIVNEEIVTSTTNGK